jgi:hypothetical protein
MQLSLRDLQKSFGSTDAFDESTMQLFHSRNFGYRELSAAESEELMEAIDKKIDEGFSQVGSHRAEIWESAWADVKTSFLLADMNPKALNPNFIGGFDYLRYEGRYIKPEVREFELSYFEVFRDWLFSKYASRFDAVYEFGSGSGFNLIELSSKFPEKELVGLDWSESAVQILNEYGRRMDLRIRGSKFDFFNPDETLSFPSNTLVMTFCAFEQVGTRFDAMLDFLLSKRPRLVIQMEPTVEFYDTRCRFDQLAIKYHNSRGYLSGYHARLSELARDEKIKYVRSKRLNFGSAYNECYSLHIWEPL